MKPFSLLVEPWKVEKSEWWPLPREPPWSAPCIPYVKTGLNMAAVGFICTSLLFRTLFATWSQKAPLRRMFAPSLREDEPCLHYNNSATEKSMSPLRRASFFRQLMWHFLPLVLPWFNLSLWVLKEHNYVVTVNQAGHTCYVPRFDNAPLSPRCCWVKLS